MKLDAEDLPEKERHVFEQMKQLSPANKRVLWTLIKISNKDHICLINKEYRPKEMNVLMKEHLISINHAYLHSRKTSIFVLRRTPHLMKKLQQIATENQSGF
ncbi:hypothetical protein CR203_01960 [Salipaludibacillus neizhouensis]|uniref:Uncharacterized protein n=1 Tax=Salipaludibacillus neizhouensis TaxID=885475 RepID=A0A3A9KE92_9BACI|nr:hypothetical protein [Salipaludibacillus neizhouensis]RKL68831.1 hypothetical protein CR203_01960 [Salipaludibacillus neizhouensis]